jgi:hypothetical protein
MSPVDTPQLLNFVDVQKDNIGCSRSFQIVKDGQYMSNIAHTANDPIEWESATSASGQFATDRFSASAD